LWSDFNKTSNIYIKYFKDYEYSYAMKILKSAMIILSPNSVIIALLSILTTYFCIQYEVYAEFPLTLIGIAVVFPIVFSISGAYARREQALKFYATLKGNGRGIYFIARDWTPDTDKQHLDRLRYILMGILGGLRHMFMMKVEESEDKEKYVYKKFSELSLYLKDSQTHGMSTSMASRGYQYMGLMMDSFEGMKHIYEYRTPVTLRAYSKIFAYSLPIIYSPYFANLAQDIPFYLFFIVPFLFSITLVSLENIQDHLENPFDMVGEDDVVINEEKFRAWLDL
jgi:predicted membrane chloride channel (bestrophin family)